MCRSIDNVAVQGRWPLTTGVAQGRYYCIIMVKKDMHTIIGDLSSEVHQARVIKRYQDIIKVRE